MKILLFFIFLSYLGYGQNELVKTSLLEKTKSRHVNQAVNLQPNTYLFKFNTLITRINKITLPFNQNPNFYKAYFKAKNTTKEKKMVFNSFQPQFNSNDFSIPLKYKYKNGSTCFYLLKSCQN
ncbi:MAG: hypothetical protein QM486_01710 [Flavobacteriaceae bacterium]